MNIFKIIISFIVIGVLCAGLLDILERKDIDLSDILAIMFLIIIVIITILL